MTPDPTSTTPVVDAMPLLDRILGGHSVPRAASAVRRSPPFLRDGRPADITKVYRYMNRGLRGVILDSVLLGGVRVTDEVAVRQFVVAINDNDRDRREAQRSLALPTAKQMSRRAAQAHEAAVKQLAAAGFAVGGERGDK